MKMTQEQAITFSGYCGANAEALLVTAESKGCQCMPYQDWFTYQRWLAQGFQVQRGEHGVKLTSWVEIIKKGTDGNEIVTGRRPKSYTAFCRCQVQRITNI